MRSDQVIIALSALAHQAQAIIVAQNSPCEKNCGNVLNMDTVDQIVCDDADYGTTAGKVFQSCVACESTSPYAITNGNQPESDLQAMLCMFSNGPPLLIYVANEQCV